MKKDFPKFSLERLAKEAGAERISEEAIEELKLILLDVVEKITKESITFSNHAKRKTIKREDILLALK